MTSTLTEGLGERAGAKTAAFLYRVLDADRPASSSGRFCLEGLDEVLLGRADSREITRTDAGGKRTLKLGITDRWMSSQHARLSRVMRTWVLEDTKSKNGLRRNAEPTTRAELADGDVIELGRTFFVVRLAEPLAGDLESEALHPPAAGLGTLSPALEARFTELAKLAPSNVSIALAGPSGSGKEVLARAIHVLKLVSRTAAPSCRSARMGCRRWNRGGSRAARSKRAVSR